MLTGSLSNYTFKDYCQQAKLGFVPDWADRVVLPNKPFDHQIGDLNHMAMFTRSGLYNEPGTGKTRPAQAYGVWLAAQQNKVVYIMPPILTPQFRASLTNTFRGVEQFISTGSVNDAPPTRKRIKGVKLPTEKVSERRARLFEVWDEQGWPSLMIISYKMFVDYHLLLKQKGYTCVVVDEATSCKTPGSQLHKAIKEFVGPADEDSNGLVLMTGTPIETNPEDAYGLIALLNPRRYGSKKAFERIHMDFAEAPPRPDGSRSPFDIVISYRNLDYLHDGLMAQGRRVTKAQALDLPPRMIVEVPVALGAAHMRLYRKMIDERMLELGDELIDMTTQQALYQGMQRSLLCPDLFCEEAMENTLLEALDSLLLSLTGRKVVVFAWFQHSVDMLAKRYHYLNPAVLNGDTTANAREGQKQKFIKDPSCQVLIANPKSGGVGVDGLQHVCSHTIFAEICPFPGTVQQAVDRLHRSGQDAESVTAYFLVALGTIAVKLRNNLVKKDYQQELIIKDKRTVLRDLIGEGGLNGSLDAL